MKPCLVFLAIFYFLSLRAAASEQRRTFSVKTRPSSSVFIYFLCIYPVSPRHVSAYSPACIFCKVKTEVDIPHIIDFCSTQC
jgi:hypothetical protein